MADLTRGRGGVTAVAMPVPLAEAAGLGRVLPHLGHLALAPLDHALFGARGGQGGGGAWLHPFRVPRGKHRVLTAPVLAGVAAGVLTRAVLLRLDGHPFPSHGHGRVNYLFLGLVAAVLGALAPAAVLTADYTAGVFLGLGLTQFHTVRQVERAMLLALEESELVPRGRSYIEVIAMTLETSNYLAMLAAIGATTIGLLWGIGPGLVVGIALALLTQRMAGLGRRLGDVATVSLGDVQAPAGDIAVGGVVVWPEAPAEALAVLEDAVGLRIRPRDLATRLTLAEPGQRQAVLHALATALGVRLTPSGAAASRGHAPSGGAGQHPSEAKRQEDLFRPREALATEDGAVVVLFFPEIHHAPAALAAVRRVPLLAPRAHRWLRGQDPRGHPARPGSAGHGEHIPGTP